MSGAGPVLGPALVLAAVLASAVALAQAPVPREEPGTVFFPGVLVRPNGRPAHLGEAFQRGDAGTEAGRATDPAASGAEPGAEIDAKRPSAIGRRPERRRPPRR